MGGQKDWSLRLARIEDAEAMPEIESRAGRMFEEVEGLSGIAGQHTVPLERLRRYIRKGHCLVAHEEGRIIGFIVTEPFGRELHVWEFDVDPDHQRRGIGAGLLRACMIDAHNSGFKAITLTTFRDVPWNAPFYERLGFEEVTALDAHPRLAGELALEADHGLPAERRCAMIRFLD
ncbi:Acetyltransferase (GNAT) family protein [Erythrobacter litoralis]|jgi:predicted N-acetyltransferase YhbS|uniref:Acetyltransferase n=1 Tax=Erythrobacter litoralis TaxID=39960 RepID=A0A074MHT5_9SPHN|nr:GNAT family N-acetyltransferase [Erythrobacter litoralis]AOL22569.1 Acetyltransferase (GNAT) family protein [Erythrobacter litoralis]KEO92385.1 acetyltransferase [Erythrobacter litoralis]MEE4337642.1 GNAT family N-acetyltransferase [Erythrobacter sp.]